MATPDIDLLILKNSNDSASKLLEEYEAELDMINKNYPDQILFSIKERIIFIESQL